MHLAAFLQAVLVPKMSSFSVKSYVPLFSICFITSVRRFWWAGLFSLLIQRLRVQTGRGASSKQTTRGTEKRRQRIQYTNKSYLQFHGCVILREEVQGLYLDFFCWSRDPVRSLWSHFRPIRLHQRALTASCRAVDRLPLRRMTENVSYSSCNVTLFFFIAIPLPLIALKRKHQNLDRYFSMGGTWNLYQDVKRISPLLSDIVKFMFKFEQLRERLELWV